MLLESLLAHWLVSRKAKREAPSQANHAPLPKSTILQALIIALLLPDSKGKGR